MAGILAASAYVPRYRLPRDLIAQQWGSASAGGERAIANHDEDSLTLALNASLALEGTGPAPDAVVFATTTSPYDEKQSAATIAAVLDLEAGARTLDVTDTLRAGTSGIMLALDAIGSGNARAVLVAAGDCRLGEPDSSAETSYGDAGAAVVVTAEPGAADIVATHSIADEFHGTWRTSEQSFPRAHPSALDAKHGYARLVGQAVQGVLAKAKVTPKDLAKAIFPFPNARAPLGLAKAMGLDPKTQLQDGFWMQLGDTGAAQPLLMLAAALEHAKAGDLILVVSYGDGADALLLRATGARAGGGPSVYRQIEVKRTLPSYGRYARFRKLFRKESGLGDISTPITLFRDRRELLPLEGGRCTACDVVQFPKHRRCIECGDGSGLADVKLVRRGTLFTFTHDFIFESPDPPTTHGVVDLEAGGRLYCQLTDVDAEQVAIAMPLELTFRKLHDGGGFHNYFWKARPAA